MRFPISPRRWGRFMKYRFLRVPCLAALLGLAGFTRFPDRAAEDALLRAAYVQRANVTSDSNRALEAAALPAAHGRVRRQGGNLVLTLTGGKTTVLHRDRRGCPGSDAGCGVFSLVAALPSRHFYLVDKM